MSKVLTDQIEKRTGGTAMDLPATGKWPTANIADDAIGADQLAGNSVVSASIVDGSIVNDDINASADIAGTKLADNAVTLAKMEDGTQGDILYYGAAGAPTRLAKGTAAQVLKINSGATAPEWGTDAGGSLEFISSHTLNAEVTTWDFVDVFSADYINYLVLITRLHPATADRHLMFRFGNSDLSSTISQGSQCMWMNYNTGPSRTSITGNSVNGMQMTERQSNGDAGMLGHVWCYAPFVNGTPAHASGFAQCYGHHGIGSYQGHWSGWYGASGSYPSFQLAAYTGNIGGIVATATVKIYGCKDS